MADYKVVDKEQLDADLTTIADAIREKGGTTEELEFPNEMRDAVLAIETGIDTTVDYPAEDADIVDGKEAWVNGELITGINPYSMVETDETVETQKDLITQIRTALIGKAAGTGSSSGIDTSDATAEEEDIVVGETAWVKGVKITGINPYKMDETTNELTTQEALMNQILEELAGKMSGGSSTLKMNTGKFTLAEDLNFGSGYYEIEHGLGEIPTMFALVQTTDTGTRTINSVTTYILRRASDGDVFYISVRGTGEYTNGHAYGRKRTQGTLLTDTLAKVEGFDTSTVMAACDYYWFAISNGEYFD